MKNKFLTGFGVILFSSQLIAQKTNETSAAIEYNKYSDNMTMMMMGAGDAELGKKAIVWGYTTSESLEVILEKLERSLFLLNQEKNSQKIYTAAEGIDEVF